MLSALETQDKTFNEDYALIGNVNTVGSGLTIVMTPYYCYIG